MNFEQLVVQIRSIHDQLAVQASRAVNLGLTLRNWLIGCHIQGFELRGEDRSQYGERLFNNLADRLSAVGVPSCDRRQLYRYVDFYRLYPQIVGTLSPQSRGLLPARAPAPKVGMTSPQSREPTLPAAALVEALSYSHFELLAAIDDPLKRAFYEVECVRGTWSVRELKRQIASLYYERSGLSRAKKKLATMVDAKVEHSSSRLTIRDPQVSPRLMSSLRVGMPVAGCQVGVARISGQIASLVIDSLYLSAMLPSDFSIVFQPPMVVGQRPRATSPLPTRAYSVRVGRSLTGGWRGKLFGEHGD